MSFSVTARATRSPITRRISSTMTVKRTMSERRTRRLPRAGTGRQAAARRRTGGYGPGPGGCGDHCGPGPGAACGATTARLRWLIPLRGRRLVMDGRPLRPVLPRRRCLVYLGRRCLVAATVGSSWNRALRCASARRVLPVVCRGAAGPGGGGGDAGHCGTGWVGGSCPQRPAAARAPAPWAAPPWQAAPPRGGAGVYDRLGGIGAHGQPPVLRCRIEVSTGYRRKRQNVST